MIYIQSKDNIPHHFDAACALYGCEESGLNYKLISFDDISKFKNLIKNNLFVGSVEFMKEVFKNVGIENVRVPRNSNREYTKMTVSEAIELSKTKKIFIKPFDIKLFTGFVMEGFVYSCLNKIENEAVMVYDVFKSDIISEWRLYIHKNKIVDSRNYSGDFMIYPNHEYILSVIKENHDFPIAYTIDIGILENGNNVVIEFNDMWSIGNYGIPNDLYIKLLRDRYFEIMNKI